MILGDISQISRGIVPDTTTKGKYMPRAYNMNHKSRNKNFEFLVSEMKKARKKRLSKRESKEKVQSYFQFFITDSSNYRFSQNLNRSRISRRYTFSI